MSALLLVALAATQQELREEQLDVEERLTAEREALKVLQTSKTEVLSVVDFLERMARASAARAVELQKSASAIQTRAAAARKADEIMRLELGARQAVLAPRLTMLYRVLKEDRLTRLVSASTFGALVRRERALSTLVKADLRNLEDIALLARYQRHQSEQLDRLKDTADTVLSALSQEQQVAQARRAALDDLLRTINAEANKSSRIVKDLEKAEAELNALINDMKAQTQDLGLRAHKGKLPFPTLGVVEVGFGKVVNPRFNTVTVQKGIDIRAAAGARVFSVGPGTVVYAGWLKGYGNLIIIDHGGGYHSLYAHLSQEAVDVGVEVEEGEEIGLVGDTGSLKGAYLYFEIRKQGQAVDPLPWLEPAH
jgi:septal ring factor EnvC (AmiA/AmiB activator)